VSGKLCVTKTEKNIMAIDIDGLTYEELVKLNHKIVERLKFLDSMHTHNEMMQFSPGDKVTFRPTNRERQTGTLVKYNKKTVTVVTDNGEQWNVAPQLLSKINKEKTKTNKSKQGNVIKLHDK
jgi:ribosomal protein S17